MAPPSTMPWLTNHQLFLHSQGGVVHVWKCKKTSSSSSSSMLVQPMKPNDFDDIGQVTNYLDLVESMFKWKKPCYQALIDYISARHLLVNAQGLVIVELYKVGRDGKNGAGDPIYIRSHDVLDMDTYDLIEPTIPFRTVQYLEDNKAPTTVKVQTKADTGFSLAIRGGHVILEPNNEADNSQYWIKDDNYAATVKDKDGLPSFALVNKFTGQAMKHSLAANTTVELVSYNPNVFDESILWTEKTIGDGYSFIRKANDIGLILDACDGDKNYNSTGGVHDGTTILLWQWVTGENQKWKIVPNATQSSINVNNVPNVESSPKELELKEELKKEKNGKEALEGDVKRLNTELATTKNEKKVLEKEIRDLEEANKRKVAPPTVRVHTKSDTGFSLTIRGGHVILAPNNEADIGQYWIKDDSYGSSKKDRDGIPSFALVNRFTGQAMKHSHVANTIVELAPYNPNVFDESILWTERAIGDGYSFIRKVNNTDLILDAFDANLKSEGGQGVHDGTNVGLWQLWTGQNQKWKIVPSKIQSYGVFSGQNF